MKLVSYLKDGVEGAGIVTLDGKKICPIPGAEGRSEPMLELMREGLVDHLAELYALRDGDSTSFIHIDDVQLLSPVPHPRDFLCIGLNYETHSEQIAKERGEVYARREFPAYFAKRTWECTQDYDLPYQVGFEDAYEGGAEIAIIIGRDCLDVDREHARDYILGYAVHNDICENEINKRYRQPMHAKSFDGMAPVGPWIVTADEFEADHAFLIRLFIADQLRAEDTSDHMSFDIPYIVSQLSTHMTLKVGTVIASGSPGEVGERYYPVAGESFVCEIEGLGRIEQKLVQAEKPTPYADKLM